MPHRGRLNVLANVMRKPMPLIFKEFSGTHYNIADHLKDADDDSHWGMSGDVKYHLGTSMDRTYPDGRRVHLSLVANPSHLECVNPLVVGKARAKQFYSGNTPEDTKAVVPILLHGDAAFAGQGIVYETMQMAGVADFDTGGTIHVVVNNQVSVSPSEPFFKIRFTHHVHFAHRTTNHHRLASRPTQLTPVLPLTAVTWGRPLTAPSST